MNTIRTMILAATLAVTGFAAQAQSTTCQNIGGTTFCDHQGGGTTTCQQIGGTTFCDTTGSRPHYPNNGITNPFPTYQPRRGGW